MTREESWHLYAASVYGSIIGHHSFWYGDDGIVNSESVDVPGMELAAQTAAKAADTMMFFLEQREMLKEK